MDNPEAEERLRQACARGEVENVKILLSTGVININSRDENGNTALHKAALNGRQEIVELLLDAGAEMEITGSEDLTPLMDASLSGNIKIAEILIKRGAKIPESLINSLKKKVDILQENYQEGMITEDGLNSWKKIYSYIYTQNLKQNLPLCFKTLKSNDIDKIKSALECIESAYYRGLDITPALKDIKEFLQSSDLNIRNIASAILSSRASDIKQWPELVKYISTGDIAVQMGVMSALVSAAKNGEDVSLMLPDIINLLKSPSEDLRHDAPIVLGYLATSGYDVGSALLPLREVLNDESVEVRQMAAWALYRMAKYTCSIQPAIEILTKIRNNEKEDSNVRGMAAEAIEMNKTKW